MSLEVFHSGAFRPAELYSEGQDEATPDLIEKSEVVKAPGFEDSSEFAQIPVNTVPKTLISQKKTASYNDDQLRQMGIRHMPGVSIFSFAHHQIVKWQSQKSLMRRSPLARY